MEGPRPSRRLIDPWVILGAIIFGVGLAAAALALLWFTKPAASPAQIPTPVLTVIALPTPTPTVLTPTPEATVTPSAAPPTAFPAGGGNITLESYVQIAGTGGDGLRLRTEPGLESEVRMLAFEAEIFQVRDGPREADNYQWWYLVAPINESQRGWAVANFLEVVQEP